jgi:hypothetical protein
MSFSIISFLKGTSRGAVPVADDQPLPVNIGTGAAGSSTATLSNVASQATNINLLAANSARKGVIIINDDANALLIKYGATASATSYTVSIPGSGGYWEMPVPLYTGAIDGIWTADGSGSARITEW